MSNYWVRALPSGGGPAGFTNGVNSAILRYVSAPNVDPTTPLTNSTRPMVETSLQPLENPEAPGVPGVGNADVSLQLNITRLANGNFEVNNASFVPPDVPVLLQILSGARSVDQLLPKGSVYLLPPNKVIEINMPGGAPGSPVRCYNPNY